MSPEARKGGGESGFSLIELMIAVTIVSILAAVGMPAYFNHIMRSRQSAVVGELMSIKAAQERFFADNGGYAGRMSVLPSSAQADGTVIMYSATGTYTSGDYQYWIDANTVNPIRTGNIMASGDPNHDGVFSDLWQVSIDNLAAKPNNTVTNEGFTWSSIGEVLN